MYSETYPKPYLKKHVVKMVVSTTDFFKEDLVPVNELTEIFP